MYNMLMHDISIDGALICVWLYVRYCWSVI